MYIIDKTRRGYTRSNNRSDDYQELMKQAKYNPDPDARRSAVESMEVIKREGKPVRDMREALIKAHRRGDVEEVRDIHDIVDHNRKFRNE